jgi:hypothetical protein
LSDHPTYTPKVHGGVEILKVAGAGLEQSADIQGKTGVAGSGGAESGAVAPVFASFSDWLDACPVDLDEATRERLRAIIGDGWPASI